MISNWQCGYMSHNMQSYMHTVQDSKNDVKEDFDVDSFKAKFIFKPFQYEESLEQTLKHEIKSLNPAPREHDLTLHQHQINKNKVQFVDLPKNESIGNTSKSLKTNKNLFINQLSTSQDGKTNKVTLSKPPILLNKSRKHLNAHVNEKMNNIIKLSKKSSKQFLSKESQDSKNKSLKSKNTPSDYFGSFAETLNEEKKHSPTSSHSMCQTIALGSMMVQNFLSNPDENGYYNPQWTTNLSTSSRKQFKDFEPLSFYSLCMLLYPQNPKSVPCSVFIIDTLFYHFANDTKEIIYVFKDRRKNMLVKMKNKGKNVFDLFLKRRQYYETSKVKGDKLAKAGYLQNSKQKIDFEEKRHVMVANEEELISNNNTNGKKDDRYSLDDDIDNRMLTIRQSPSIQSINIKQGSCYQIIAEQQNYKYSGINAYNAKTLYGLKDEVIYSNSEEQADSVVGVSNLEDSKCVSVCDYICLHSQKSVQDFKQKFPKLYLQDSYQHFIAQQQKMQQVSNRKHIIIDQVIQQLPIITPSNSMRESFHSLQTNYMALLKYNNGQIMRLKTHQFKAIFQNPLYANEKFKNNNNTQYIQMLPIEDEFKDLKVYSMHFHYELFKNESLFLHVRNSLYKENQYMTGVNRINFQEGKGNMNNRKQQERSNTNNGNMSLERKNNLMLKKRLKQQSIEVYLYYQIFEMHTYASMHYNKQIMNGIFRFIEYDKDYALFQAENVIVRDMGKDPQFMKAKIFNEDHEDNLDNFQQAPVIKILKQIQRKASNYADQDNVNLRESDPNAPSQTTKKIVNQLLKLASQPQQQQSQVQKQIISYFSKQNTKIQSQMQNYFTQKVQKIKNIKDMQLSKNIFKIINDIKDDSKNDQLQSWSTYGKNNEENVRDFHQILNNDQKLEKFLKEKEKTYLNQRRNISNFSVVRCQMEVQKVRKHKKEQMEKEVQREKQKDKETCGEVKNQPIIKKMSSKRLLTENKPHAAKEMKFSVASRPSSAINHASTNTLHIFTRTNRSLLSGERNKTSQNDNKSLQNSKSLVRFSQNQFLLNQNNVSSQQFKRKLINQKYTEYNKGKFKLKGFRTDKFM